MKEISLCHCRLKLHGPVGNKLLLFRLMRASRKADAEYSNDHYNWLQWKRLLFKYISECTVNWAKVQLCLCSETASGFILSGRLCSLNLGFISVAECSRYLWLLFVREDAKPGRSGCFNTGSSWIAQALGRGWRQGQEMEGPATIQHHTVTLPQNTYLYLAPNMTPKRPAFLTEPLRRIFEAKWQYLKGNHIAKDDCGYCLYDCLDQTAQTLLPVVHNQGLFDWFDVVHNQGLFDSYPTL